MLLPPYTCDSPPCHPDSLPGRPQQRRMASGIAYYHGRPTGLVHRAILLLPCTCFASSVACQLFATSASLLVSVPSQFLFVLLSLKAAL